MTHQRNYWFCMISCLSDLPLSTQKDTDCSWHKSWRMVSLIDSAWKLSEKNYANTINPLLISESFKFFSLFLMFSKDKKNQIWGKVRLWPALSKCGWNSTNPSSWECVWGRTLQGNLHWKWCGQFQIRKPVRILILAHTPLLKFLLPLGTKHLFDTVIMRKSWEKVPG